MIRIFRMPEVTISIWVTVGTSVIPKIFDASFFLLGTYCRSNRKCLLRRLADGHSISGSVTTWNLSTKVVEAFVSLTRLLAFVRQSSIGLYPSFSPPCVISMQRTQDFDAKLALVMGNRSR